MESLNAAALPAGALLLVDSPPIIYVLEGQAKLASRYAPLFERHAACEVLLAVTTITVAEVLAGPLRAGNEELASRYRAALASWQVIPLDLEIAERAARLRASVGLRLADAVQAASAIAINAHALVTHNRDFARLEALRVLR
jgi:predicted nucleic acid-binding protein